MTFDQARLIRHNRILAKNGIAPDGMGYSISWFRIIRSNTVLGEYTVMSDQPGLIKCDPFDGPDV
jgi:hypothetical protein